MRAVDGSEKTDDCDITLAWANVIIVIKVDEFVQIFVYSFNQ